MGLATLCPEEMKITVGKLRAFFDDAELFLAGQDGIFQIHSNLS